MVASLALMVQLSAGPCLTGTASWYFAPGGTTATGRPYKVGQMGVAHKTLPFGTRLRITHAKTGRRVVVKVTDRGPYVRGRQFDLTRAAARELGIVEEGVAPVRVEILGL